MIIESGIIIFLGLVLLFVKLPRRLALRLLGYPLALDVTASVLAYLLHWGTFTGVMAAAVAGLRLGLHDFGPLALRLHPRRTLLSRPRRASHPVSPRG